jgi:hypothetical protein
MVHRRVEHTCGKHPEIETKSSDPHKPVSGPCGALFRAGPRTIKPGTAVRHPVAPTSQRILLETVTFVRGSISWAATVSSNRTLREEGPAEPGDARWSVLWFTAYCLIPTANCLPLRSLLNLVRNGLIRHSQSHDRLRRVQTIFGLGKDHRVRAVNNLVRHLVAAVGGKGVHVKRIGTR